MKRLRADSVTFRPRARTALVWGGLAVSAVFAYLAVRDVDFDQVWSALQDCSYWTLVPAFVLLALANMLRAWRWQLQFEPATRPRFRAALSALLIGTFFNTVLPARAGEAAQVLALRRSSRVSFSETAATVLLGRVWDLLSVLALLFVLVAWLPSVSWLRAAAWLAVGLVVGLFVVAIAGRPLLRFGLRPLARLPFLSVGHTDRAAAGAWRGFYSLRRPGSATAVFALTIASWVTFGLSNWFVLEGFSLGLSPLAGILVAIAIALAMILPSSPGAVGVFEAAVIVALHAYGVPKSEALSVGLVLHALNLVPYLIAGFVCLHAERRYAPRGAAEAGASAGLQNQ